MDSKFSAQMVTKKGRNYKFDAIECMIWFLTEGYVKKEDVYGMRVSNYAQPKEWINAEEAHFLISPEIRSPMGAHLAAFPSQQQAQKYQEKLGGEIYSFNQIIDVLSKKKRQ